jgi:hypothetical protein
MLQPRWIEFGTIFGRQSARYWCLFSLVALPLVAVQGAEPSLPFSLAVTEEKLEKLPDYMGPGNSIDMDFPYCPIMIDGEYWIIYKNGYTGPVLRYRGTNIENAVRQPDGKSTTPSGAYILGGLWYDAGEKKLYAPLHYEVARYGNYVRREIHLATSADKGLTWKYEGPILTSDDSQTKRRNPTEFSGLCWDGGDGDHVIYVDERGGYIYLFTNYYSWPKIGSPARALHRHRVARCAIADKMAPGKWMKFYDGAWSQPGIAGKASWVNAYDVIYDTYLKKYISIDCPGALSTCDDLAKQDWSPSYHLGPYWCSSYDFGFWATNESKNDTLTGGRTLYVYNFWQKSPGRRFRIDFGPGQTAASTGFTSQSFLLNPTGYYWGADPAHFYAYVPLFESSDPIDARRTRRVGCTGVETHYTGTWTDSTDPGCYEGRAKIASDAGASVVFKFRGRDIYWRAVKGPGLGKADVFLDGVGRTTVDCWGSEPNGLEFAFIQQGLSDGEHTIKIVVRGEKNRLSTGGAIKHMLFEYSAETYRASDCFSSVNGKNQWHNQERDGTTFVDMTFHDPIWKGKNGSEVGFFQMTPGIGDAVRKWVAPHDGTVRIEGAPTLECPSADGINVAVLKNTLLKNTDKLWTGQLATPKTKASSYDTTVAVQAGDSLAFIAQNTAFKNMPGPGLGIPANRDAVQLNGRFGKPLKIGAKEFARGLYCTAGSKMVVHLPEPGKTFSVTAGVDANKHPDVKKGIRVSVTVGSKLVFKSDVLKGKPEGIPVDVDLDGATEFVLEADDDVDWAGARVVQVDGKEIWLDTLPLQDQRSETPRVLWDPVITYLK